MWGRRSTAYNIEDAFSPHPTSINTSTSSALFCFFSKNSWDSVCFFWLWLSSELIFFQEIFSSVVFQGVRARFTLPTSALYRALQNRRVGKGNVYLWMGSCFMSLKKKKNECFKNLPWREKPCFCSPGYREENSAGVQAMPHSEAILPSKDPLCNVMFLTTVKISPHPPQWKCGPTPLFTYGMLWRYVTQFQKCRIKYSELPFHDSFLCNVLPLAAGRVQDSGSDTRARWSPGWWGGLHCHCRHQWVTECLAFQKEAWLLFSSLAFEGTSPYLTGLKTVHICCHVRSLPLI